MSKPKIANITLFTAIAALSLTGLTLASTARAAALPSGVQDSTDAADLFVKTEVRCYAGQAALAVRSRDSGIEQLSFAPLQARSDTSSKLMPVTCSDGQYRLGSKDLTNTEVATFAMANNTYSADSDDWVLIITPNNQPATYVPEFSSKVACEQAANVWQGQDRESNSPGRAVCVQR